MSETRTARRRQLDRDASPVKNVNTLGLLRGKKSPEPTAAVAIMGATVIGSIYAGVTTDEVTLSTHAVAALEISLSADLLYHASQSAFLEISTSVTPLQSYTGAQAMISCVSIRCRSSSCSIPFTQRGSRRCPQSSHSPSVAHDTRMRSKVGETNT